MKAKIKYFDSEWKVSSTITTDPLTVTDSEGNLLNDEELAVWAEAQAPAIYQGKRWTPLDDADKWLRGLQARHYTYMRIEIVE